MQVDYGNQSTVSNSEFDQYLGSIRDQASSNTNPS